MQGYYNDLAGACKSCPLNCKTCSAPGTACTKCFDGWANCDSFDGCEADLSADAHCGSCTTTCTTEQLCSSFACVPRGNARTWGARAAYFFPITLGTRAMLWNDVSLAGFPCDHAGHDDVGQLGDGPSAALFSTTPVSVHSSADFIQISAGYYHTCAIDTANHALCWGAWCHAFCVFLRAQSSDELMRCALAITRAGGNGNGQLGDNTLVNTITPVSVFGGHSFQQIDAGMGYTCAIDMDNAAHCWGELGCAGVAWGECLAPCMLKHLVQRRKAACFHWAGRRQPLWHVGRWDHRGGGKQENPHPRGWQPLVHANRCRILPYMRHRHSEACLVLGWAWEPTAGLD